MTAINRSLTDDERSLLLALTRGNIADETGCSHDEATAVLGNLVARGEVEISGDAEHARVLAAGQLRVEAKRDWLAFHSVHKGCDPMRDERRG